MNNEDTIAAIASSHDTPGHRGIIRVSGPDTSKIVERFFSAESLEATDNGGPDLSAIRRAIRIPGTMDLGIPLGQVPCDLYLWPTHRSYTQQPSAELHTYGAVPVLNAALELTCQHGARLARPGEFTLRSFLSGRIDLAQAEAVLGVIDARNDQELNVALRQLAGGLSGPLQELRNALLNLVADLEAGLDFADEDIEFVSQDIVIERLMQAKEIISNTLSQMQHRLTESSLSRVVLRGEPNVGKSTLWNGLVAPAQDEMAIVDDGPGTTRDYLVGQVNVPQGRFLLIDTAGVEPASRDVLNASMMRTADEQVEAANLLLLCIESGRELTTWEKTQLASECPNRLVILTKSDLGVAPKGVTFDFSIQRQDKSSLDALAALCCQRLQAEEERSIVANTAARCRESLRLASESVDLAISLAESGNGDELLAGELRIALDHLGEIVGAIYTDDVLDRVFSRFCIGK